MAFTGYDSVEENILDKSYGELIFSTSEWGFKDGQTYLEYTDLETHTCSEEELGLVNGEQTRFMQINESSIQDVIQKKKSFKCMKKEDSYIFGNYNSNSGRMIRIKLNKCANKIYCKPENEIIDFFRGKYLLFINN